MGGMIVRVSGLDVSTQHTATINFEVLPEGGSVVTGGITVPFSSPEAGINGLLVTAAKAVATSHGLPVADGDPVMLLGGISVIAHPPAQFAHVVMKGSTVDSVFIGAGSDEGPAEAAAQARASGIAVASEGDPQEDALRQAPWITRAPANPS